jgi:hypothetical protein
MVDDPNRRDNRDRSRVGGDHEHDVRHFAKANRISLDQARDLITAAGMVGQLRLKVKRKLQPHHAGL